MLLLPPPSSAAAAATRGQRKSSSATGFRLSDAPGKLTDEAPEACCGARSAQNYLQLWRLQPRRPNMPCLSLARPYQASAGQLEKGAAQLPCKSSSRSPEEPSTRSGGPAQQQPPYSALLLRRTSAAVENLAVRSFFFTGEQLHQGISSRSDLRHGQEEHEGPEDHHDAGSAGASRLLRALEAQQHPPGPWLVPIAACSGPSGPSEDAPASLAAAQVPSEHEWLVAASEGLRCASDSLEELLQVASELRLPHGAPWRIEALDVSHLHGSAAAAGCAVLLGGSPAPREHMCLPVLRAPEADDCAALSEALEGRLGLGGDLPDLLLIDGGRGQLSAAEAVLKEFGLAERIPVASLAKSRREILFSSRLDTSADERGSISSRRPEGAATEGLVLPPGSPALRLLQRARDEAHALANLGHRELRGRRPQHWSSSLDGLAGVGASTKVAVLRHFGGDAAALSRASADDLQSLRGVGPVLSHRIAEHLGRIDDDDDDRDNGGASSPLLDVSHAMRGFRTAEQAYASGGQRGTSEDNGGSSSVLLHREAAQWWRQKEPLHAPMMSRDPCGRAEAVSAALLCAADLRRSRRDLLEALDAFSRNTSFCGVDHRHRAASNHQASNTSGAGEDEEALAEVQEEEEEGIALTGSSGFRGHKQRPGSFDLSSAPFSPTGDQPQAIRRLVDGVASPSPSKHRRFQVLKGATGTGKTFVMANVIAGAEMPALVLAPNKVLAAQLCNELKQLFPRNKVEYFVSYYDYFRPESYKASSDRYLGKVSQVNEDIDRMRHAATRALFERQDTVVVASVSCIYGLGLPDEYLKQARELRVGDSASSIDEVLQSLELLRYRPHEQHQDKVASSDGGLGSVALDQGSFAVAFEGSRAADVFVALPHDISLLRVKLRPAEEKEDLEVVISGIELIGSGGEEQAETAEPLRSFVLYPASHHVMAAEQKERIVEEIRDERDMRVNELLSEGRRLEAQRLMGKVEADLQQLSRDGHCRGIENYSRHFSGRASGEPPACLLDYFPDDWLLLVDESHITIPQLRAMYAADRRRKLSLVEHGFRLPSALDNRPLKHEEFWERIHRCIFVSATPGKFEAEVCGGPSWTAAAPTAEESSSGNDVEDQPQHVAELVHRPTGILDPVVEVRPASGQMDNLLAEIYERIERGERSLVTTLTKRMAEELSGVLNEQHSIRTAWMHSGVKPIQRMRILGDLRSGLYDVLVGVNLLREGLDLPEVSLVAVMDADKEGFLRSRTSLIQTIGRAARHVDGTAILYADRITDSMQEAMDETSRRRTLQQHRNDELGIVPHPIRKSHDNALLDMVSSSSSSSAPAASPSVSSPATGIPRRRRSRSSSSPSSMIDDYSSNGGLSRAAGHHMAVRERLGDSGMVAVYDALCAWRSSLAAERRCRPFRILQARTLEELAREQPADREALLETYGIGPAKLHAYGDDLVQIINGAPQ